ncbi:MAG: AIPR family protein [Coriobacteriia bacterium]|nr:AIPR family protein [Coriobacteriia bacterium]
MAKNSRYRTLVNVLDCICREAPPTNDKYYPKSTNIELVNQARSRAYIHLYLKVQYGILDFVERERWITDGPYDGGIDAYYIDKEHKRVDFIQSKFRATSANFEQKDITYEELLSMDVDRITDGEPNNENGKSYNDKIHELQKALSEVPDIGQYDYQVVVLANLREHKQSKIRRLTGPYVNTVFDHKRSYNELVFPVVSGTYYNESMLCIPLDLSNTNSASARVDYSVKTEFKECDISLVFVPTIEIARILHRYKNSVLKYNPRSYLGLKTGSVNRDISNTIVHKQTNEFALFNNGITMLSDETGFNQQVGAKDKAQVVVSNPQIINGGQTAFTLSRIYEQVLNGDLGPSVFQDKEVLLKIITFSTNGGTSSEDRLHLIEDISRATNSQTPVTEADRRANDKIQVDLQREMYERYGYYYERKRGEFEDGLQDKYIDASQIVRRVEFLRSAMACNQRASEARGNSENQIFSEENFSKTLASVGRLEAFFFGYCCYLDLVRREQIAKRNKKDKWGVADHGHALRYGKFSVIAACSRLRGRAKPADAERYVEAVLGQWNAFESASRDLDSNQEYFRRFIDPDTDEPVQELNYSGYYKGSTLNADLKAFGFKGPE